MKKNIITIRKKYMGNEKGFTLVEMLTVIAIFVVIGGVVTSILVTSFRTSSKTDIVAAVQNSGNYALSQMAKTIRDARGLVSPFPCTPSVVAQSITIITPDNQQIIYSCTSSTIASNGASLLDTNQVALQTCSFTCMQESDSDLPVMKINFSLQQKSSSTFAEKIASQSAVVFQTSVGIRNINR
jgi:prepilin-type N-terminal cleavage/methylation domain-containing protein